VYSGAGSASFRNNLNSSKIRFLAEIYIFFLIFFGEYYSFLPSFLFFFFLIKILFLKKRKYKDLQKKKRKR